MKPVLIIALLVAISATAMTTNPDNTLTLSEDEALEMAVSINNLQVHIADQAYELAKLRRELKACNAKVEI